MYLVRSTAFLGYGSAKFTKSGLAGIDIRDLDSISLKGKSFMVTGGNAGIGYSVSKFFAAGGGTVHVVCRSEEKGKTAIKSIVEATRNEDVHLHVCDVSEMKEVRRLAEKFISEKLPLDVLVHNAGLMAKEKAVTSDGIDKLFATNLLSNFLLTNLLFPVLNQSPDGRVIIVSSGGGLTEPLETKQIQFENNWDPSRTYAITKRQQIALTEKFARFYKDSNVGFYCMHPGWADTPGVQDSMPEFRKFYLNSLRTPEEGADTINWLSVSPLFADRKLSGEFFRDRAVELKHLPFAGTSYSEEAVDNLWKECATLTAWE